MGKHMKLSYLDFRAESTWKETSVDQALEKANKHLESSELDVVSVETLWLDHGIPTGVRVWLRSKAL
jgi:hypothetical protein